MNFDRFFTNQDLDEIFNKWKVEYPNLIKIREIGKSHEGRPVWLLAITDQETGADLSKPAMWVDANIHATEITGTTVALNIAHDLLAQYGKESGITHLLKKAVFYIVPRVNPDGAALAMAKKPQFIRSGTRPYPYQDKEDGLHPEDIDNDGRILQMRIPDPNGDWKISTLDPRLMQKREPHEIEGNFYRLLPEGMLENYDGYLIKMAPPHKGLDFNRNFPYEWKPEADQRGAGPFPASEPEIKALVEFISSHPNINIALTYHTYSRAILRPYSTKPDDEMAYQDLWVFQKMGEIGTAITGYRCVSTFHDFLYAPKEITTGAFDDWMYDHLGIFCFTVELWDLPTEAGIKDKKFIEWHRKHPHEDDLKILKWLDENVGNDAYIEWHAFDHPQLGPIEIGGWNTMYTWRNPPPAFLAKETEKNVPFAITLGKMLPGLSIHTLETTAIQKNTFSINLVIENTGFLPTYTNLQGKKRKSGRPVRIELGLPDTVKILTGKNKQDIGHLEGRSSDLDVSSVGAASPTDNRARVEWTLYAEENSSVTINISSDRAGSIQAQVDLQVSE